MQISGKKTYIVALAMLAFAAYGMYLGKFSDTQAIQFVLQALGLAGLRNALPAGGVDAGDQA